MAQRTRRSSPIASPPVPPMTKILMMKMSNSFVRGSSRRPVSAFLLRKISRAIMQYQHAGSAFYKWPSQSDRQQCQIQSNATSRIGAIHMGIYVFSVAAYSAPYPIGQHYQIASRFRKMGAKLPNTQMLNTPQEMDCAFALL